MNKLLACALILLFAAQGCFWPFTGGKSLASPSVVDDATSVEVLGAAPFQGVKKVYFEPFAAGTDVPAGDAFDHLALMMVKGFLDGSAGRGRFILVSGDDAGTADLVIKGHIEGFKRRGYFTKTVLMKVRGDIRSSSSMPCVSSRIRRKIPIRRPMT